MALIKCPECKKKISDQCENCPQCGYPIKNNYQTESSEHIVPSKKPFYKKVWFLIVTGVVLISLIVGAFLLLNRDTKPKLDNDGNPIFVELTNEVYSNVKKYKGYHVNIKGEVFQVMSESENVKGIQIWLDPDTCEQNLMIYYNTDVEVKQGDYIMCSGYIDSVTEYKNAYGATLYAPMVFSSDLKKSTYMEVMAPETETITPENLKQEKYGYSVSIDKIEFSEKETRVYVTATNNGKTLLYVGDSVIVQGGKQYNSETNYEANYDEIPFEIVKGASCSGIIVFPTISTNDFEFTIDINSDDSDENLGKITVLIGKEKSEIKVAWPEDKPIQKPATNPTHTQPEKPKNRNKEAVAEAINQAIIWFPTDRHFIEHILENPSLEEGFDAFTYDEATYAIENADIDWKEHALQKAKDIVSDDAEWSQSDLYIEIAEWSGGHCDCPGFTEEEVQYAIDNCGMNWE